MDIHTHEAVTIESEHRTDSYIIETELWHVAIDAAVTA